MFVSLVVFLRGWVLCNGKHPRAASGHLFVGPSTLFQRGGLERLVGLVSCYLGLPLVQVPIRLRDGVELVVLLFVFRYQLVVRELVLKVQFSVIVHVVP